jgi:Asp-tRNA(Asn)/Glu-tRNA(Gln) amidotransferase A subunit family amidase
MQQCDLGLVEAAAAIVSGQFSSCQLVSSCLERIEATEEGIGAWAFLDPAHCLEQAKAADDYRGTGRPLGPLHGVPVGIKDIIDTSGMPTEFGSPIYAGRRPLEDATVVSALRAAGAVIMGKTVTTEFASFTPGKTRNPHDPARTPGGSSSGSAAAVAARMVPGAIGTQTAGSVIRPASYCGVVGFKPSFGLVPRRGILSQSRFLDTVGTFGRSLEDAALLADCIIGHDPRDPDSRPVAHQRLLETARSRPPVKPDLAFVRTPMWDEGDADMHGGFAELVEMLGERVEEVELPEAFGSAIDLHRTVMLADFAKAFARDYEHNRDQLSERLRGMIADGGKVLAADFSRAMDWRDLFNVTLDRIFERYNAIITPAAPGAAPLGLEATGSPVFCSLWTFCGVPAVTLPLLQGEQGLPIGVQVVGRRGDDARLLRTARWLAAAVEGVE